jgi:hypothetical protein
MTLEALQTDLWLQMDVRPDLDPSVALGAARLSSWINRAYRHICLPKVYKHRELQTQQPITLVLDQRTYSIAGVTPSVWAIQHLLSNYDDQRLMPKSFRQILDITRNASGIPRAYGYWGQTIYLDYAPNAQVAGSTIDLFYFRQPAALTAGQVTLLRDIWDQVIVQGATWYGWMALNQPERADDSRTNFGLLANEVGAVEDIEKLDDGHSIEVEAYEIMERV